MQRHGSLDDGEAVDDIDMELQLKQDRVSQQPWRILRLSACCRNCYSMEMATIAAERRRKKLE